MTEVPEIVRERLRRQATSVEHPDANLLSAFAEHTLTEPERVSVLDHLSRCADCRQILALSAPQLEQLLAPAAARSRSGVKLSWWRSPVVHWGALTAAALVVLVAVGARMRLREGHSASAPAIAKYEPAQQPTAETETAPVPTKQSATPAPAAPPASTSKRAKAIGAGSEDKQATLRKKVPAEVTAQIAPVPPTSAPSPTDASESSASTIISGEGAGRDQLKSSAPSAMASGAAGGIVGGMVAAPAMKAAKPAQRESAMLVKRPTLGQRWSVSESGALQRSLDGGRSWNEIAVAGGVRFRALATVGQDVWAGGSGGALYHSTDNGEHWLLVPVQTNGRALSGDILRIEFADPKNGVVTASTGETWTTSDGGATWR